MAKNYISLESLRAFLSELKTTFAQFSHKHTKSDITDFPTIPSKVSELENDLGFASQDSNITYSISKTGDVVTLNGSDGSTSDFIDSDTTYEPAGVSLGLVKSGGDVTINDGIITVNNGEHNHAISNIDGLQAELDSIDTALSERVPVTRTINGNPLSDNILLAAADVGADATGTAELKANAALEAAKDYTNQEIADLIDGAPTTLDTLGEVAAAMGQNADVVEALESAIGSKANADVVEAHTGNVGIHVDSTEKNNWNAAHLHSQSAHAPVDAEVNQNAFSNFIVGSAIVEADAKTDSLTLEGENVTLTPDVSNDKITIGLTKSNVEDALEYTPTKSLLNSATVLDATKTTEAIGDNQAVFAKGAIFSSVDGDAGVLTKAICGVTTPSENGACEKANLLINYDGDSTYRDGRQLLLQSNSAGEHYGNNLYQFAAARGDAVKGFVDSVETSLQAQIDQKVPITRTINGQPLSDNVDLSFNDVGADESGSAATALINANTYTDTKTSAIIDGASTYDTLSKVEAKLNLVDGDISQLETKKANAIDVYTVEEVDAITGQPADMSIAAGGNLVDGINALNTAVKAITPTSLGVYTKDESDSKYLPLVGGTVTGPTTFEDTLNVSGVVLSHDTELNALRFDFIA